MMDTGCFLTKPFLILSFSLPIIQTWLYSFDNFPEINVIKIKYGTMTKCSIT